jgi:hypothetical protein
VVDKTQFIDFLKKKADKLEMDAGYSGSMNDFGARALREQIECWLAGQKGEVPALWNEFLKSYSRETDPEYADYLRLQRKFGK